MPRRTFYDPLTGQRISEGEAFVRFDEYAREADAFARELRGLDRRFDRARLATTKLRLLDERELMRAQYSQLRSASDQLLAQLVTPTPRPVRQVPPKAPPPKKARREPSIRRVPSKETAGAGEARAVEWELGIEYDSAAHRKTWHLDVNVRVYRVDGRPMTGEEAREVFDYWVASGAVSSGYAVRGVRWSGSRQAENVTRDWVAQKTGDTNRAWSDLNAVLSTQMAEGAFRLGPVKDLSD
jgi:hypothetical protein